MQEMKGNSLSARDGSKDGSTGRGTTLNPRRRRGSGPFACRGWIGETGKVHTQSIPCPAPCWVLVVGLGLLRLDGRFFAVALCIRQCFRQATSIPTPVPCSAGCWHSWTREGRQRQRQLTDLCPSLITFIPLLAHQLIVIPFSPPSLHLS